MHVKLSDLKQRIFKTASTFSPTKGTEKRLKIKEIVLEHSGAAETVVQHLCTITDLTGHINELFLFNLLSW